MKNALLWILLLLGLLLPVDSFSTEGSTALRTVRVGYYFFDGYHILDQVSGERRGYGYEYLQNMLPYVNWKYEYVGYDKPFEEMLNMLERGEIDLMDSVIITPERQKRFDFSLQPIAQAAAALLVRADSNIPYVAGKYATYTGMRVGLLAGSSQIQSLQAFAREKGFTYRPVYYKTSKELANALQAGTDIDAIVTSSMRLVPDTRRLELFDSRPTHVIVRKGDSALLNEVNFALEQLNLDKPTLSSELYDKYYPVNSGEQLFFTPEERIFISRCQREGKIFQAVFNPSMAPVAFFEKGEISGILGKIAAEIIRRTGLHIQVRETATSAAYQEALADPKTAIWLDAVFNYSRAEDMGFKLTDPYYTTDLSLLTRKDHQGPILALAAIKVLAPNVTQLQSQSKPIRLVLMNTPQECLGALQKNACDAICLPSRIAQRMAYNDITNSLAVYPIPGSSYKIAIGIRHTEGALLSSILNKAANSITTDFADEKTIRYSTYPERPITFRGYLYSNPLAALGMLSGLFALLVILLLYNKSLTQRRLIQKKNLEIQESLHQAEMANAAKSEFLSRMSHDIRTPLNGIIGMTYLARQESLPPQASAYLDKVEISSKFLLNLINDILDLAKVESGMVELQPEPYLMSDFESYIASVIRPLCEGKAQTFLSEAHPVPTVIPIIDSLRFNQIIFNLLSNAVKYTPERGIIQLKVYNELRPGHKEHILVHISDNGIGMSETFLAHLFDAFSQEGRKENSYGSGTGLGLAIVKKLVDLMGGSIAVQSVIGQGTTFTLDFDFDYIEEAQATWKEKNASSGPDMKILEGKRVLLCEDHPINQTIEEALLGKQKMIVEIASNGQIGVEKFCQSSVGWYDLILMDIRMPLLDGYEATKQIRSLNRSDAKTVPIIAMTANAFSSDVEKCLAVGMTAHIAKPIDPKLLYDAMLQALAKHASGQK